MLKYMFITLWFALFVPSLCVGQYLLAGKVEYERKVNVHAQYEGSEWFERYKSEVAKDRVASCAPLQRRKR
jgi:hypothetical protein